MPSTISILNLKGGAGKTTIATNLAVAFAMRGNDVLLIDTDKQSSSLTWSGERPEDRLNVATLSIADPKALKKQIPLLRKKFGVIIIDGAPHADLIASETIMLSDLIILPVGPSPLDLWATEVMVERIGNAQIINPSIKAVFLINRYSERITLSRETVAALDEMAFPMLKTKIGNRVAYADAILQGLSVLEYQTPNEKAHAEITQLYEEITQNE